jgi:hypothetical protein
MSDMGSRSDEGSLLRLTPRGRLLVGVLAELRYLTVHQIQQVCFPTLSVRATSRQLSQLRGRGVLTCLRRRTFEDRRAFWGLGPLGRAAAAVADTARVRPSSAVAGALLMDHLVATNQIFCDLCGVRRAGSFPPFVWMGSQHTRVDLGLTHLVPDALIVASGPQGEPWLYCVERDRGTMSTDALADKFARYRLLQEHARTRASDPVWDARANCWMMLACDDELRAARAARIAIDAGVDRVWAGLASECAASLAGAVDAAWADGPSRADASTARLPGLVGGVVCPAQHAGASAGAGDPS